MVQIDKVSGLSEYMTIFDVNQLECTYLAFLKSSTKHRRSELAKSKFRVHHLKPEILNNGLAMIDITGIMDRNFQL